MCHVFAIVRDEDRIHRSVLRTANASMEAQIARLAQRTQTNINFEVYGSGIGY